MVDWRYLMVWLLAFSPYRSWVHLVLIVVIVLDFIRLKASSVLEDMGRW